MKILILRFSSIGDIVLTTPIVRCVKRQLPNAQVHYLTKKKFESILEANPYIDKKFYFVDDVQSVILDLVKEKYDIVIDLHKNMRTLYVKSLLRQAFNSHVKSYSFRKLNFRKWLLTTFKWNTMPSMSIVERYFETVKCLGVKNDGQGLDYFIQKEDEIKKDDLPMSHSQGFVACSIGGQHETKKMPLAKWSEFCKQFNFPLVILGGPEDKAMGDELSKLDPIRIYNACGKFSLNESAHIVSKSRFVISHDTGLMHIAAAFKKPIISIWGNTVPELGMFPYYGFNNLKTTVAPQSFIFENKKISCRPCSKIGFSKCPKKHFNCMNSLEMASLLATANRILTDK